MAARMYGRPVLQPTDNRVPPPPTLDRRNSLIKKAPPPPPPTSPKSKSPRLPTIKRSSSSATATTIGGGGGGTTTTAAATTTSTLVEIESPQGWTLERKKSKGYIKEGGGVTATTNQPSSIILDDDDDNQEAEAPPRSLAAVRREQMALYQAQRKMKIAHYGRRFSEKFIIHYPKLVDQLIEDDPEIRSSEKKRCSFITPTSDPIYIAYHDQEWGVPVHDDKMLLELLFLSGAQVGSDWTSILKTRQHFRYAFSGFDAQALAATLTDDKQIRAISSQYGIEITRVRAVVDNATRILKVSKEFGSFDKYIWGFVNQKPISTQYKYGHKIPIKTSKSESISKDMVRRGFRFVGPTVVCSFMQAAGLTNDHLITCPHRQHRRNQ